MLIHLCEMKCSLFFQYRINLYLICILCLKFLIDFKCHIIIKFLCRFHYFLIKLHHIIYF
jgi:hypothetical protein